MSSGDFIYNFMDKLAFWIIPIAIIMIFYIFIGMPLIESHSLDKWCIEQGFDDGRYEAYNWGENNCIIVENNTIIKTKVDYCGKEWCFVK